MSTFDALQSRYEETPYRDQCFPDLDVGRMLAMARLFRLGPEPGAEIRVLDLACASGLHLRRQAERYPGVHFTGIDFSSREIEIGREAIREQGLGNVELIEADLRAVEIEPEAFDLVLCHGTFSWVTDEVKQRIFELSRRALAPSGLAAIVYLTYPGWKQRESIRELLLSQVREDGDPDERIRRSALVLRLLHAGYASQPENPQAQALAELVESMQKSSSNVFLHDELGREHDPCYFLQFVEWAAECGLRYLAETDLGTMACDGLPEKGAAALQQLAPDFLETQQLIDFLVNRSGRSSILIRNDAPLAREIDRDVLEALCFTTDLHPVSPLDEKPELPVEFASIRGRRLEVGDGETLRLLSGLIDAPAEGLSFAETIALASADEGDRQEITSRLLGLISRGLVDPRWLIPGVA
jgi:SAM-dependent methyltransferase